MANEKKLYLKGLYTYRDKFSEIPEGALSQALNVTLDKANIANPRPGFNAQNVTDAPLSLPSVAHSFQDYNNDLYLGSNKLLYRSELDANSIINKVNLPYSAANLPSASVVPTIMDLTPAESTFKYAEMRGNLYFTTSNGIRKTFVGADYTFDAGVPVIGVTYTELLAGGTLLAIGNEVSYRLVIFKQDLQGNIYIGPPTEAIVIANSTGGTVNPHIVTLTPPGFAINSNYTWWLQVYRTKIAPIGLSGSEFQLASEEQIGGDADIRDTTPDSYLGASLYTNDTQEGPAGASYAPPYSKCIERFNDAMFYANTKSKYSFEFRVLNNLTAGNTITITTPDLVTPIVLTAAVAGTTPPPHHQFRISALTGAQAIEEVARNIVSAITNWSYPNLGSPDAARRLEGHYVSGVNDIPGKILVTAVGDYYTSPFTIASNAISSPGVSLFFPSILGAKSATQEVTPNRLWWSKTSEPEAVPLANYKDIGDKDDPIIAIKALRDRLIIIKTKSIWRLVGSNSQSYDIQIIDNTVNINAPLSIARLSNRLFALSNQGIVHISDSVQIISRRIHDQVTVINSEDACGAADGARGLYYLVPRFNSTGPTPILVYNSYNDLFTTYELPTTEFAGYFSPSSMYVTNQWSNIPDISTAPNNRLLVASSAHPIVQVERKNFTSLDYSDNSFARTMLAGGMVGSTLNVTVAGTYASGTIAPGDTIHETGVSATGVCTVLSILSATQVEVQLLNPFFALTVGTGLMVYKAIETTIEFWPFIGEGIDIYKEFNEAALMYPIKMFGECTIDFKTDEIYEAEEVVLESDMSTAMWGHFPWGGIPWGHAEPSDSIDERVIIPFNATKGHQLVTTISTLTSNQLWEFSGITLKYRNIGFTPNRRQK